ncbi:putative ArsR family transcriptional regulator [Gordonia rhizosphera NBRC 16068]|uniref:Putative ArsR family transcriptional regulator n=2 Tax=Gordonia rhizosphera TaxID=83341 RepID=K6W255_9ACTN|nr:putative ArsR family transcriptional regulator [Gordonia rhizosphera NBRC 16068]
MTDDEALEVALRLKALADPVRIRLLSILMTSGDGALCTGDLAPAVGLSEATVSHHLTQLRKAGMVESVRQGMNVHHSVRTESLEALRRVLAVDCC